jgi:16S rRNA (guanine527-N7)-methyltransferase
MSAVSVAMRPVTSIPLREHLRERARAAGVAVPDEAVSDLETYMRLLVRWNQRINLTALPLDPPTDAAIDRLFIEPLVAARYVTNAGVLWFDLGSGGGSPAIPLKLVRTGPQLVMVESKHRKAAFLREAIRELAIEGADVRTERFQDAGANQSIAGTAALVTVRAVKPEPTLFSAAASLLKSGGELMLFGAETNLSSTVGEFNLAGMYPLLTNAGSTLVVLRRV